ncbi:MAG TPA: ABC transporter permease [Streptosporangiaceae bacterium]|jgi:FtsX-like permease family|nr:ABC transporter permease [Streptosporangiaceae bacterium]
MGGAAVMVLRGRRRQFWRSWLALSVLVAVTAGFVLTAIAAGQRTAAAFPGFRARHGYDLVIYSVKPLPELAGYPNVTSVTPVTAPFTGQPTCRPACTTPIDAPNFLVNEVRPADLGRMVTLLSGRLPDQSRPGEVLASFTLEQHNGVRPGSVISVPVYPPSALTSSGNPQPDQVRRLRVVGIAAADGEFPGGGTPHYDLFATTAFATAVNSRAATLSLSYLRFRHGEADLAAVSSRLGPLHVLGTNDLDADAGAVRASIGPQVAGWYVLAGLAALVALAVIAQAVGRQAVTESADHRALAAIGLVPGQFVLADLVRTAVIGTAGAAGAVALAVALSPLTPVGEARLADPAAGAVSVSPLLLATGALVTVAVTAALAVWPAVRQARRPGDRPETAGTSAAAIGQAAAAARLPAPALIGIRYAVERGRGGQPVATALLGTILAVAALCATAVFGASLAHLNVTPALYGEPFQEYFASDGEPESAARVTGPLLSSLRSDPAITQITLAVPAEVQVNGKHVQALAVAPVRGQVLLATVDGRRPAADREIMLGAATMRDTGASVGGTVLVTLADPAGKPHRVRFLVTGRAALNAGTGGLGNGAALTLAGLTSAVCPPGEGRAACVSTVGRLPLVMVRAESGQTGTAALARYSRAYPGLVYLPRTPAALVNFGESVSFPLLFGVALSVFGAATMAHLLLVSVARRRREAGLLKVLGFLRRQVGAALCWQASAVALAGIVIGTPAGLAAGRALWRLFATSFGVVPVPVVRPLLVVVLLAGVLAAANLLAAVPALLAARARPGPALRAE